MEIHWTMLSRHRNKKSAKRFFKKCLGNAHVNVPRVINIDKSPTFPPALEELQKADEMSSKMRLRPIKYMNNSMENDYKSTKFKSQLKRASRGDVCAQNKIIDKLFGLAA